MCGKLIGELQSRFLDNYVIVSVTISCNGQGGQKGRGLLLHLSQAGLIRAYTWAQKRPAAENKWTQVSWEVRLSLDMGVMDGFRPPTTRPRGAPSTGPKANNEAAAKNKTNNNKKNHAKQEHWMWQQKQARGSSWWVQNWNRHTQEVIVLVTGNTFTHKELCFQPDSSLCAEDCRRDDSTLQKVGCAAGEAHMTYSLS